MLEFKKITLADFEILKPFFEEHGGSAGIMLMWRNYYNTSYAIADDTLIIKSEFEGETIFSMPIGKNCESALELICEHAEDAGIKPVIGFVTAERLERLKELYECDAKYDRDLADYIYLAEDLAYMRGRRYSGQRGHINAFMKNYPDFEFKSIDNTTLPDVKEFYEHYLATRNKYAESFLAEAEIMPEIFDNLDLYGFETLVLYADGKVAAFAMGERVGDTLYEHIEKADASIRGSFQMIASGFARTFIDGVTYVNREDDAGDEGLRKSKLSYHPCTLLEKYTVTLGGKRKDAQNGSKAEAYHA
ncbi:MAG: DUF2156 domain-containing protein [Clostridia bacterium]|nr:DUF2156 domain-containing protein [Clostridia bacterium]